MSRSVQQGHGAKGIGVQLRESGVALAGWMLQQLAGTDVVAAKKSWVLMRGDTSDA